MEKLTIEHCIPIPEKYTNRKNKTRYAEIVERMDIKDSVIVDTLKEVSQIYAAMRKLKYKQTVRRLENGKYRVWRVL